MSMAQRTYIPSKKVRTNNAVHNNVEHIYPLPNSISHRIGNPKKIANVRAVNKTEVGVFTIANPTETSSYDSS